MTEPAGACVLCRAALDAATEDGLCSACGFAVHRVRELGLAIVPAGLGGDCVSCLHLEVCRVYEAAESVGAVVGACPVRRADKEEAAAQTPTAEEGDQLIPELLAQCDQDCPHHEGAGALPQCRPQAYQQRVSYCDTLRLRALERTGGS